MTEIDPENRRRSQRVLLPIGVLLRTDFPNGKSCQVQAFTLVVNAHRVLLEAPIEVVANQKMTLANPQTEKVASCRAVGVKGLSESNYTIAFEFDERHAQFWPIRFPPENWEVTEELKHDHQ